MLIVCCVLALGLGGAMRRCTCPTVPSFNGQGPLVSRCDMLLTFKASQHAHGLVPSLVVRMRSRTHAVHVTPRCCAALCRSPHPHTTHACAHARTLHARHAEPTSLHVHAPSDTCTKKTDSTTHAPHAPRPLHPRSDTCVAALGNQVPGGNGPSCIGQVVCPNSAGELVLCSTLYPALANFTICFSNGGALWVRIGK